MSGEDRNGRLGMGQRAKGRRSPLDGEKGMRYGKRNFISTAGQGLIARKGAWHLVAVPSRDRPGWHNFKLYLDEAARKNLFHFGVSENGLNNNREMAVLDEHYPGVKEWAGAKAQMYIDGLIPLMPEKGKAIVYRKGRGWVSVSKGKKNGAV